ncbi:MAG TPA: DUF6585 family protein [Labilithrix sp.]|jgi:hypothetical protein
MKQPYRVPTELAPDPPRRPDDMGELVSKHRAKTSIGPSVAALVLFFVIIPSTTHGVPTLILVSGAGLFVIVLLLLGWLAAQWKPTVELWDKGIVVKRRWTHPRRVRFEDVDAVFYDTTGLRLPFTQPSVGVTLTTHAGGRLALPSDLSATDKIVSSVDRRVTRPLLAPAKRAFADGDTLHFGPLLVHERRIAVAGLEPLAFEDLDCVEARGVEIRFYRRGKNWPPFATVSLHAVPHPRVLLAVLATRVPVEDATGLPS